jgi:hypothetical protein
MVLRANGIETLVLFGISTSGVVLSMLLDASDSDYRIMAIKDCCADLDPELHAVLIDRLFPQHADVLTSGEFEALLKPGNSEHLALPGAITHRGTIAGTASLQPPVKTKRGKKTKPLRVRKRDALKVKFKTAYTEIIAFVNKYGVIRSILNVCRITAHKRGSLRPSRGASANADRLPPCHYLDSVIRPKTTWIHWSNMPTSGNVDSALRNCKASQLAEWLVILFKFLHHAGEAPRALAITSLPACRRIVPLYRRKDRE